MKIFGQRLALPQRSTSVSARYLATQVKAHQQMDVTPANLRASADRMLDYYTAMQTEDGGLKGLHDSCHYCKLPNALIYGGRVAQADKMLNYCHSNFYIAENGDFMNDFDTGDKTLHWEFEDFYSYLNQWWITAGVRLNRFEFTFNAYKYVHNNWYNKNVGCAIVQSSIDTDNYQNCIFNSAHLGLTNLFLGKTAIATKIGDTMVKMIDKQPCFIDGNDEKLYFNRFDDNLELLTEETLNREDGGVKLAAILDCNEKNQCWWSMGYPIAYLAQLYKITGKKKYLKTSETLLNFIINDCCDDVRNNIISHKVMWGASVVANITGKKEYWDLCKDIAFYILNTGQGPAGDDSENKNDGRVIHWHWERGTDYGQAQIIDQTAEIAYWFNVVANQMEHARTEGRM